MFKGIPPVDSTASEDWKSLLNEVSLGHSGELFRDITDTLFTYTLKAVISTVRVIQLRKDGTKFVSDFSWNNQWHHFIPGKRDIDQHCYGW